MFRKNGVSVMFLASIVLVLTTIYSCSSSGSGTSTSDSTTNPANACTYGTRGSAPSDSSTTAERILISILSDPTGAADTDTLYTLDPSATPSANVAKAYTTSDLTELFTFNNSTKFPKDQTGRILYPRINATGSGVYFGSGNTKTWTILDTNLFFLAYNSTYTAQLTPVGDEYANMFDVTGCTSTGTVSGTIGTTTIGGVPTTCASAPVYLSSMTMANADANCNYSFTNVPPGEHYITAYKPGDATVYDSSLVSVTGGATTTQNLTPDTTGRSNFVWPTPYVSGSDTYIYSKFSTTKLQRFKAGDSAVTDIYATDVTCTYSYSLDGFDICTNSSSANHGKIAILDYAEGCSTSKGLYLTSDAAGTSPTNLLDMKPTDVSQQTWHDVKHIFWSPDCSYLAFVAQRDPNLTATYVTRIEIVNPSNGAIIDEMELSNISFANASLYGWSPNGGNLLYSTNSGDATQTTLYKAPMTSGSFGTASTLLENQYISGATWGNLMQ